MATGLLFSPLWLHHPRSVTEALGDQMLIRTFVFSAFLLTMGVASYADDAGNEAIARDFCHAVAAQALCEDHFTMAKGTEAGMEAEAGGKLRGEGSPLNAACEAGYNAFYDYEAEKGLDAACIETLGLYGEDGTERAGLVSAN